MEFENYRVMNLGGAVLGMRNPKESWDRSDSVFGLCPIDNVAAEATPVLNAWMEAYPDVNPQEIEENLYGNAIIAIDNKYNVCEYAFIGPNDMKLAQSLIQGGSEHRKFMRQIFVTVDITAPIYW